MRGLRLGVLLALLVWAWIVLVIYLVREGLL